MKTLMNILKQLNKFPLDHLIKTSQVFYQIQDQYHFMKLGLKKKRYNFSIKWIILQQELNFIQFSLLFQLTMSKFLTFCVFNDFQYNLLGFIFFFSYAKFIDTKDLTKFVLLRMKWNRKYNNIFHSRTILQQMNNYKQFFNLQWQQEIEQMLQSRNHIHKLQYLLDSGKRKKFEIPNEAKEQLESMQKLSKEIKKVIIDKASIEQLEKLKSESLELKIFSNEMQNLEESFPKCILWLEKIKPLKEKKNISYKQLQSCIQEYRQLMIKEESFNQYKNLQEKTQDQIEKIQILLKNNKTRTNSESISFEEAIQILDDIKNSQVETEEFDLFKTKMASFYEFEMHLSMFLDDKQLPQTLKQLQNFIKESNFFPFQTKTIQRAQNLFDYYQKIEKIQKNLDNQTKFDDIQDDLEYLNSKFESKNLDSLNEVFQKTIQFNEKFQQLQDFDISINFEDLYNYQKNKPSELKNVLFSYDSFSQQKLLEIMNYIDTSQKTYLQELQDSIQLWKQDFQNIHGVSNLFLHLQRGFKNKFYNEEIQQLLDKLKLIYSWLAQANCILKHYVPSFNLKQYICKNPSYDLDGLLCDQNIEDLKETEEYKSLIELKQRCEINQEQSIKLLNEYQIIPDEDIYSQFEIQKNILEELPIDVTIKEKLQQKMTFYLLKKEFQQIQTFHEKEVIQNYEQFEIDLINLIKQESYDDIKEFLIDKWQTLIALCTDISEKSVQKENKLTENQLKQFIDNAANIQELDNETNQLKQMLDEYFDFRQQYEFIYSEKKFKQKKHRYYIQEQPFFYNISKQNQISYLSRISMNCILLYKCYKSAIYYPEYQLLAEFNNQFLSLHKEYKEQIDNLSQKTLDDISDQMTQLLKLNSFTLENKVYKNFYYWVTEYAEQVDNFLSVLPQTKFISLKKMNLSENNCYVNFNEEQMQIEIRMKDSQDFQEKRSQRKVKQVTNYLELAEQHSDHSEENSKRKLKVNLNLKKSKKIKQDLALDIKSLQFDLEDLDSSYCICRKGHDGIQDMFQCEICEDWFHNDCLAVKPHISRKISTFQCMACCLRNRQAYQIDIDGSEFKWHNHQKVSYEQFLQLYEEGEKIPIQFPQKSKIQELKNQIDNYISQANYELKKGIDCENIWPYIQEQQSRDQNLLNLIKEGIYLPVQTEIFPQILLLLQRRDISKQMRKFVIPNQMSTSARNSFFKKDLTYARLFEDPQMLQTYQSLQNRFHQSMEVQKELNEYIKSKAEANLFRQIISVIENQHLIIENIEQVKRQFGEFCEWEAKVDNYLHQPQDVLWTFQQINSYKNKYDQFICSQNGLYSELMALYMMTQDWLNKILRWKNEGEQGNQIQQLLKESYHIKCYLPQTQQLMHSKD